MKTFFHKNKILLISLSAVLLLGVLSGLLLGGVIRLSAGGSAFETVAEARERQTVPGRRASVKLQPETEPKQETEPTPKTEPSAPVPTPVPQEIRLSAAEIQSITTDVQHRRRCIIPVHTEAMIPVNKQHWESCPPSETQEDAAREAAEKLTQTVFGTSFAELTGAPIGEAYVTLYLDTENDRDAILCVRDPEGVYLLFLREKDLGLICADLLTYPDGAAADRSKENIAIAQKLGYTAKPWHRKTGRNKEEIYYYKTETETCLTFAYIGNKLWQAAVFPNRDAAVESEYFLADLQSDYSTPAFPESFEAAEPPTKDNRKIVTEAVLRNKLNRLYTGLTGGSFDKSKLTIQFFRDKSGAREDCWRVTGEGFDVTVSAYSRNVIKFTGSIPCKDLLAIPYKNMGGEEYYTVTEYIGRALISSLGAYGGMNREKDVRAITDNAVYDGHCCTMDIELMDGTFYECKFRDGVLEEILYYADERLFMEASGWVADSVYKNSETGKLFIPNCRDWDGDLHVSPRPEVHFAG